uniref:Uncharacterized protein n=1 Tax=Timema cristinae TaxID=61476 RepID=A0A7R9DCN8_TIMCR|nr:unnamed protein product [Timema cristinae]
MMNTDLTNVICGASLSKKRTLLKFISLLCNDIGLNQSKIYKKSWIKEQLRSIWQKTPIP